MRQEDIDKLQSIKDFPSLVAHLRDELDWPIEVRDADEVVFEYDPRELGIDPKYAVKIESIRQIRPLVDTQPWAIFYIEFEAKRLPVLVLRRVLGSLVLKSRRRAPDRPAWGMNNLLFISAQGEAEDRSISFAHFHDRPGRTPELRVFSWDSHETHFYYLKHLNLEALRWPEDEAHVEEWRERWSQAFAVEHRYVITKSQQLASELARHAATVRDLVTEVFDLETEEGALHRLFGSFKETLLHDLTPRAFADMVAQTVAYGLFSARTQSDELTYDRMVDLIPTSNPLLKGLLAELTTQGAVDLEELGVGQLVHLLRQTDIDAILRDFGRRTGAGREDPVVHFYELFLREYDREQKVRRGVFYTPDPVVSYIVRSVHHLLKTEFGLADGLADTAVNADTGEPLVQILDPAVGTGTFLVHVIDEIERTVKAKPGVDWSDYVARHLLPRLHGFELMMAPYAVGHMKLGLKLQQTGYNFARGERLRVYLTNTLEEPVEVDQTLELAGFLSMESNEAARVKRRAPVSVIVGNPPYSKISANRSEYAESLLDSYKEPVRQERNLQPLSDDYLKFLAWAHQRIGQTGWGVVAMITNHSYLYGIIHRGVREKLIEYFDRIYVLDLHGNSLMGETPPSGASNENVFDIRQGVSIGVFVRLRGGHRVSKVYHYDLWGSREYKYGRLSREHIADTDWECLDAIAPNYSLSDVESLLRGEYDALWSISAALPIHAGGTKTHRDHLVIDLDLPTLRNRIADFLDDRTPDSPIRAKYFGTQRRGRYEPGDNRDWSMSEARSRIRANLDWETDFRQCTYRPFDARYVFYNRHAIDFDRRAIMNHMHVGSNVALLTSRISRNQDFTSVFVTRLLSEMKTAESTRGSYHFPLYLYVDLVDGIVFGHQRPTGTLRDRRPNLDSDFVTDLSERLGLHFISDGYGDLSHTFGPEDVFHYMYSLLHSPSYRERYADFLRMEFPRLPLTSNLEMFAALVALGADLVAVHLLEDRYPAASWSQAGQASPLQDLFTTFVEGANGTTMGAFSKGACYDNGRVYLDSSQRASSSYFEGVPEDVWNFHIGGYQVCRKWLYDRRGKRDEPGRTLTEDDIAHYQRIVVAIAETIRLMEEIDEVIDAHGGWPIE